MIKFNRIYKAGKQEVVFQEKPEVTVYASYGDESIEGRMTVESICVDSVKCMHYL